MDGPTHTFITFYALKQDKSPTSLGESRLLIEIIDKFEYFDHNSDTEGFQKLKRANNSVCTFFFLNSSEPAAAWPHEYPASVYKHVHAVGGEDADEIM